MNSIELVSKTIKGENPGRTPVYGWVRENLTKEITEAFGSVEDFEDHYEFDMAHIFGGPYPFSGKISTLMEQGNEITPEILLQYELSSPDDMQLYQGIISQLNFYQKDRERFCYVQTPGFFEQHNDVFGIENHLMYLALYPEEIKEVYQRQLEWNKRFADNCIELGINMIHVSDDWGAQNSLMFAPDMFRELIAPYHEKFAKHVKSKDVFLSLHSDGNINSVLDDIVNMGFDVLHPYQEAAGMSYDRFLNEYSDSFTIFGGICVQTTLGFNNYDKLKNEIERVFKLLKGKRFLCCTTHFVQDHCSIEELTYAYDLVKELRK